MWNHIRVSLSRDGFFSGLLNARVVDLMDPFKQQAYVHAAVEGSTSIKYVLPVLAPALSDKALVIQEGATATTRWNDIVTGKFEPAAAEQLRAALLSYCALDTLAMVEIWRVLMQQAGQLR